MGKLKPWLRFIEGENGDGGGSAEGAQNDAGGSNDDNGDNDAGNDDRGSGDDSDDDDAGDDDGDDSDSWKKKSRTWEKRAKADAKRIRDLEKQQQDFQDSIATALGLKKGENADPKQLAQDLSAKDEEISAMKLENSILRAAPSLGVDGDMLLDSRSFSQKVEDLDPDSGDFRKDLQSLIRDELKNRPNLALRGGAAGGENKGRKSGKETQGKGAGEQLTREDLKKMTPAEIEKARTEGRLKNLLGG